MESQGRASSAHAHRNSWTMITFVLLLGAVGWSRGLRLTNMNAPLVADIREEMELDCHFDMGVEELYAVKWYKDDQEFFRFMPRQKQQMITFPVAGVHLVPSKTTCSHQHCQVRLTGLTRDHSGGAYRCEISSEAPAFRLASETHNVTVAAIPREQLRIEGLAGSYAEGDVVTLKCVSDLADPAPILSWDINGHPAPSKAVGQMTSSDQDASGLVARTITLSFRAERRLIRGDAIEIRCVSALPGIPLPPQVRVEQVRLANPQPPSVINNQKLHWTGSNGSGSLSLPTLAMLIGGIGVRWATLRCFLR